VLAPYRDTVSLTFPAQTQEPVPRLIPLPERFFAGGGTSLRGFALNQAGPRDSQTGFPVGGQAMLVFNQEFRFPLRLPYAGNRLGGTLFYDGGNVYKQSESHHAALDLSETNFRSCKSEAVPVQLYKRAELLLAHRGCGRCATVHR